MSVPFSLGAAWLSVWVGDATSVLSIYWLSRLYCDLIFPTALGCRYYSYPHFTDDETEAQRALRDSPQIKQLVSELESESGIRAHILTPLPGCPSPGCRVLCPTRSRTAAGKRGRGPRVPRMFGSGRAISSPSLQMVAQTPDSETGGLSKGESWPLSMVGTEGTGWTAVLGGQPGPRRAHKAQQRGREWEACFSFLSDPWWELQRSAARTF